MADRLHNKVAIITGGGQGIGAATALRHARTSVPSLRYLPCGDS